MKDNKAGWTRKGCGVARWLLMLGLVVALAPMLVAQTALQTGLRTLSGTVTDKSHEPLSGAVVQLHNDTTGSVVSFLSTPKGGFDFKRLSPINDYTVWATYRGHKSKVESMSRFDSKSDKVVALVIELD